VRIKRKPNRGWRLPVTSLDQRCESGIVASVASSEKAWRDAQLAAERAERGVRRQPSPEHRRAVETARRLVEERWIERPDGGGQAHRRSTRRT
jgi:hypothetical protein